MSGVGMRRVVAAGLSVGLLLAGAVFAQEDIVGPSDTKVSYGDWSQHCMLVQQVEAGQSEVKTPVRVCEVRQELNVSQENGQVQRLLTIAIGKLPGSDVERLVVQTPNNVALRAGVTVALSDQPLEPEKGGSVAAASGDGDEQMLLTYVACGQVCAADKELSSDQFEALKMAKSVRVTFDTMNGQSFAVPLSMRGFKDAVSAAPPVN